MSSYTVVLGVGQFANTGDFGNYSPTKFYVVNDWSPDRTCEYGSGGLLAALAAADDRYGVIGLTSSTKITVNCQYKVGNGQRINKKSAPSDKLWFSHDYERANERRSPTFYTRFDSDLRRNQNFRTEFRLEHRAAWG